MGQLIKIINKEIMPVIYDGVPVLTMAMVDDLHDRKSDTARKRFNENRERFIEGEDYFDLPYDEWSAISVRFTDADLTKYRGNINVLTESGYLLLVKSFNDDLSWQVQRALVRSYFTVKGAQPQAGFLPPPRKLIELPDNHTTIDKDELIALQKSKIDFLERSRDSFSEEEKTYMLKGRTAGMTYGEMAKALGRNKSSIYGWLNNAENKQGAK